MYPNVHEVSFVPSRRFFTHAPDLQEEPFLATSPIPIGHVRGSTWLGGVMVRPVEREVWNRCMPGMAEQVGVSQIAGPEEWFVSLKGFPRTNHKGVYDFEKLPQKRGIIGWRRMQKIDAVSLLAVAELCLLDAR